MARTKLDKFARVVSLNRRGVLCDGELFNHLLDRIHESPDDLTLYLDASPPRLVARFREWADSHPTDDAAWVSWMQQERFNLSSAGSSVSTHDEKQMTRTIVEGFRRWQGRPRPHAGNNDGPT